MKKFLLLALLVVGCTNSTESIDEIKEVSWVFLQYISEEGYNLPNHGNIKWVDNKPYTTLENSEWENCYGSTLPIVLSDDTLCLLSSSYDSVRSIIHYLIPNYFEIYHAYDNAGIPDSINPENYYIFKFEYK